MGSDTYCAICGAPAHGISPRFYDTSKVSAESMQWLDDVNIITQTKEEPGDENEIGEMCFTGPVEFDDHNWYTIEEANNSLVLELAQTTVRVYDHSEGHDLLVPFHNRCYELPEKVDYDDASACQDKKSESWKKTPGMEYLVASPTQIPRITEFINSLLADSKPKEDKSDYTSSEKDDGKNDVLGSLPGELMSSVLECLDYDDLSSIRLASRNALKGTFSNAFWRAKLCSDMKWALEFIPSAEDPGSVETDWFKVYKAMRAIANGQDMVQPFTTTCLRNRSRVWGICSKMLEEYWPCKAGLGLGVSTSVVLIDAGNSILPIMRYPHDPSLVWAKLGLMNDFVDVRSAQPIIAVFWSSDGELAGLGCRVSEAAAQRSIGAKDIATSEDFKIPEDSWINEMVIISGEEVSEDDLDQIIRKVVGLKFIFSKGDPITIGQGEGDLRVMYPNPDHFVVGFKAGWAAGTPLSKLALMFQPMDEAPLDSLERLESREGLDETGVLLERHDLFHAGRLWKNALPLREHQVLACKNGGYCDRTKDDLLMESLVFGTTESDLAKITAIGVDALLRGFELCLEDGSTRSIGHTSAMQYLSIDGRGGERILYCYSSIYIVSQSIRFVTNRGRQLLVGDTTHISELVWPDPKKQETLMGIYCHWVNRHSPGRSLSMMGAFSRKNRGPVEMPTKLKDEGKRHWTPSPPPEGFWETSKIYGQREVRRGPPKQVPDKRAIVSWLDCSRPIESVKVVLCHGSKSAKLPMVSLSFKYSDDQTTSSIGPTKFDPPKDTRGANGNYWCWCHKGDPARIQKLKEEPHYTVHEWNVEGSHLKFLNLWVDREGILTGLQFIGQGEKSPAWDFGVSSKPIELPLKTQRGNRAVAMKLFVDSIEKGVTREDYVVVAVQLLGFIKS
ncbi:hypothetical protein F53441_2890 [Fusarium austroafricanum]|uniref:F-box domain-containing protein n=1 Tax=Fusarium austroafricanum TaxID=2364996 RepID=A0A8H4KQD3_9HYPO|nr:hypothetical protein F53441_2890 [Fusarium austroafricanum]